MKPFNIETPSETKIDVEPQSITPEIDESVEFSEYLNATTTGHIGYFAGNPAHASIQTDFNRVMKLQ